MARFKALGVKIFDAQGVPDGSPIAQRILDAITAEETYERDQLDQSALDESVLKLPR